jgi:L-aspartate oxidase
MMQTDFLVLGSGIAGLAYAIKVAGRLPDAKITIITKSMESESSTRRAQGGIAAVMERNEAAILQHIKDTLGAGDGLCEESVAEFVVREGAQRVRELISWGAEFDRDATGKLDLALEGGHRQHRVLHRGDQTGLEILNTLLARVRTLPNITICENLFATELIITSNERFSSCTGAWVMDRNSFESTPFFAHVTMLATGGIGQVYLHTSNPAVATGDGVAMARRAGAVLKDMEFVQFHPTVLYSPGDNPAFLISEAVRGAGAVLRRKDGSRFMDAYDKRAELAPRDIVSRAIDTELNASGGDYVLLDCSAIPEERFRSHFPNIYQKCRSVGIRVPSEPIPVVPAMHYLCGGISTDAYGRTSVPRLYACGECARTGLHGANRLASNSLLEALVFAHRSAYDSTKVFDAPAQDVFPVSIALPAQWNFNPMRLVKARARLREIMSGTGITTSSGKLKSALLAVDRLTAWAGDGTEAAGSPESWELHNMLTVARTVLEHSLSRKSNKGVFHNADLVSVTGPVLVI